MNDATQSLGTQPLPVGHELLWYQIEEILGHGGFGMTYLATDTNLNRKVAIKEYLPSIFAFRNADFDVNPLSADHEKNYTWGLTSFLNEARTLAQFKHRNVVQVQTVFEAYNTAYMVMEYEHGESLDQVFKGRIDQLNQSFFEKLLFPVMEGLQAIHDAGFIHRDIKPGNLYLRSDGSPVLIDFGSARQTSQQETSEMTTLVSQGYTPLEQYSSNFGEQGPWTDIYSLAASVYHGITGKRPEDALNRSASLLSTKPDPLPLLTELAPDGYSETFCHAIDCAMLLKPADRPRALSDWTSIFEGEASTLQEHEIDVLPMPDDDDDATRILPPSGAPRPAAPEYEPSESYTDRRHQAPPTEYDSQPPRSAQRSPSATKKKSNAPLIGGIAVLVAALAGGGWWFSQQSGINQQSEPLVTADLLSTLPQPPSALSIITPQENTAEEIKEVQALASVYRKVLELDPESEQGTEGLIYVLGNYKNIAELTVVQRNEPLRILLRTAVDELSIESNEIIEDIESELRNSSGFSSFKELEPLLDTAPFTTTEREHLVYGLANLQGTEKDTALADSRVETLSGQFKSSIIEAIQNNQFDQASHMTGLALLIDTQDKELLLIKNHLQRNGSL